MIGFTLVIVFLFVAILIGVVAKSAGGNQGRGGYIGGNYRPVRSGSMAAPWSDGTPPAALGVPEGHPARMAAERLEAALGLDMEARVKDRILRKHTRMQDKEWEWTWFELKRFFLLCGVLRGVPMYSSKVDEVWHEMLMFTREYEQFCKQFTGDTIHHAPHGAEVQPDQGERALFDWAYGELFEQAPASGRLWGAFYRTPMSASRLQELDSLSADELRMRWFNSKAYEAKPELRQAIDYMVDRVRRQHAAAKEPAQGESFSRDRIHDSFSRDAGMTTGLLSGLLIMNSVQSPSAFQQEMDGAQTEEERKANSGCGSSSSCSVHDDSSDSRGDQGGSGNDGGAGSSCSSGSDGGSSGSGGGSSCGGSSCGGGGGCGGGS